MRAVGGNTAVAESLELGHREGEALGGLGRLHHAHRVGISGKTLVELRAYLTLLNHHRDHPTQETVTTCYRLKSKCRHSLDTSAQRSISGHSGQCTLLYCNHQQTSWTKLGIL